MAVQYEGSPWSATERSSGHHYHVSRVHAQEGKRALSSDGDKGVSQLHMLFINETSQWITQQRARTMNESYRVQSQAAHLRFSDS
jgi:hypothetical protein